MHSGLVYLHAVLHIFALYMVHLSFDFRRFYHHNVGRTIPGMSRAIDAAAVDERLAQELSAAREAFSNYRESLKVTPQDACFRQDDRSIRRAHAEAIKQNALSRHRLRKIVIGAGSKHHSNMDNDACKHALYSGKNGLRDMKMEGVNYGT